MKYKVFCENCNKEIETIFYLNKDNEVIDMEPCPNCNDVNYKLKVPINKEKWIGVYGTNG